MLRRRPEKCSAWWIVLGLALCASSWGQQFRSPDELADRIADLNAQLESLTSLVPDAPGVAQVLSERGALLRDLIAADPRRAAALQLNASLAAQIRAASPQSGLEQEGDWTGVLSVSIEDDFASNRSRHRYSMRANGTSWEVFFGAGAAPSSSASMTIHGVQLAGRIAAMRVSPEVRAEARVAAADVAAAGPECSTIGVQDTAVILVTTPSRPVFPAGFTPSYFQQEFFGTSSGSLATDSLNRVTQEMSHGQTSVAGQVFGPFALTQNYSCDQYELLLDAAIGAADASINFTQYRRIIVVFPVSSCMFEGLGTIGCRTEVTPDGTVNASVSWLPIFSNSKTQLLVGVFAHEFGHNLGLHHADTDDFGRVPLGRVGITGASVEYGDPFSIMGQTGASFNGQPIGGQYSAAHKSLALRWLANGAYQEAQTSGVFNIVPFENSSGLRALRVLRDAATSSWLWLEYRQPLGDMDSSLSFLQNSMTTNIFQGALIHYEDALVEPTRTNLLDFTPVSQPNQFGDALLTPGNSWSDPYSLLRIAVNSASTSGVSVTVTYDPACATLSAAPVAFPQAGGSGSITVTAPSTCSWTASTTFGWIVLTGSSAGQGNGSVPFTVFSNNGQPQRNGYITVQRQSVPFVQEGSGASAISVTPRQGSGTSGQFTFIAKNPSGFQNISRALIAFSDIGMHAPNTCMINITRSSGTAFLLNDSGSTSLSGINLLSPGQSVSNSQCTLFSTGSSIVGSGSQLTITLRVSFALAFSGSHRISAQFDAPAPSDTIPLGMWTVGNGCGYSLGSTSQSFGAAGGTGSASVFSSPGCAWSAASNDAWITVTSGSSGNGDGSVSYSVASNMSASPRSGTMTIAGQSYTVQQSGNGSCSYFLLPTSANFNPAGGTASVAVTAPAGCGWTAISNATWVTITSGNSGSGNGGVGYSVAVNSTAAARSGTLTIGGQAFTVQQSAGSACSYALSSTNAFLGAAGGAGGITVTAPPGCVWTVVSDAAWLTVTSGSSGSGNGMVGYAVSALASLTPRTATLNIAGLTFSVVQDPSTGGSLAQIASGGTWKTSLTFLNLGTVANSLSMNFFGDNGTPLNLPMTFPQTPAAVGVTASTLSRSLNPGAQLVVESAAADSAPTLQGWGNLQPTAGIKAFGIFSNPVHQWEAVVPLESRDANRYILAFDNTGAIATGVALANLAGSSANIPVTIRDSTGSAVLGAQVNLPAFGHKTFMLADLYSATLNQRGVIEFQTPAGGHISALGLRANGAALTTLPVLTETTAGGGSVAHLLFNGGFTNSFTLVNTGTAPALATLSFFAQNGTPLTVPLGLPQTGESFSANLFSRTLAAGASLLIETAGDSSLPVVVGSAKLSTNGSVDAFGIFRWTQFGQEASVPLEQRTANSYVLPFDNTSGLTTGLALANADIAPAAVTVVIRNDAGTLLQSTSISLPGNGQTSFMLPDQYPAVAGKRGTVEFVTPGGGRISVIGLRATPAGNLTTISVLAKQ